MTIQEKPATFKLFLMHVTLKSNFFHIIVIYFDGLNENLNPAVLRHFKSIFSNKFHFLCFFYKKKYFNKKKKESVLYIKQTFWRNNNKKQQNG